MGSTLDLGKRIELISMDPHFHDITIGLYQGNRDSVPEYLVHSYSGRDGAPGRVNFVTQTMALLGGMEVVDGRLHFRCGAGHRFAVRRLFLESCKVATDAPVAPKPLTIFDKKLNAQVTVTSHPNGLYEVTGETQRLPTGASRLESITGGFRKLAELDNIPGEPYRVAFACGQSHDDLMGLLLPRALNVRAVLREEEMASSRGVLVAPSAQK